MDMISPFQMEIQRENEEHMMRDEDMEEVVNTSDEDTELMSETEIDELRSSISNPAAYSNHQLLHQYIPVRITAQGRRPPFHGVPWEEVVKDIPELKSWLQEEADKKFSRQTEEEQGFYEEGEKSNLHQLPHKHIQQTVYDKKTVVGQFFAFIQLIEGKNTKLRLRDLYDSTKIKAFTYFIGR
jgi:hypothetical protein